MTDLHMHELEKFQQWLLYTPYGRYVLRNERSLFLKNVSTVFGYYSLQLGLSETNLLQGNKISNCYILGHDLKTNLAHLPFATNSVDLIVCPHMLEFHQDYGAILQECYRVLVPEGKLIITTFNPNLLSLIRFKFKFLRKTKFIPINDLKDSLIKLNFNICGGSFLCYAPAVNRASLLSKLAFLDKIGNRWLPTFANIYSLSATKQLVTSTTIPDKDFAKEKSPKLKFGSAKICKE